MFEKYTEGARRVIFFGRYEASALGTGYIETEHLLLGLLREDTVLKSQLPMYAPESIRQQIVEMYSPKKAEVPESADMPLSLDSKRALGYAADGAIESSIAAIWCWGCSASRIAGRHCF